MSRKKTLAEHAAELYSEDDYNCAESLIRAADRYYDLHLDDHTLVTAAGFGGGVGIGNLCGALSGAVMALSVLFVRQRAHESEVVKMITSSFLEKAGQRFGSLMCIRIKEDLHTEQEGCLMAVTRAAELLEETVDEFSEYRIAEVLI